jgi:hypothetical protein
MSPKTVVNITGTALGSWWRSWILATSVSNSNWPTISRSALHVSLHGFMMI